MRAFNAIVVVAVLAVGFGAAAFAQGGLTVHKYDSFGFSVSLPSDCQPVSLGNYATGAQLQESYSGNGLAYLVLGVTDIGTRMGASVITNMIVQQISTMTSKVPGASARMLSATTAQGFSVPGFGILTTESGKGVKTVPPQVQAMLGNSVYQAVVFIPVVETPAQIAIVAVVGPSSRQGEVDSELMRVTQTFTMAKPGAAGVVGSATGGATHDVFSGDGSRNSKKPAGPPQPIVKPMSALKKGQIELIGMVKTTDAATKSVDMLVTQVAPFGANGAVLNPPRLKRVYVKTIEQGVKEGAVIIVVAKDTGPGKAVNADSLTVMDLSKLAF